jgi:hypothetical protein
MALNGTLRVGIEVPTKEELGITANASRLPNTFGNNWNDPAFRASHHKRQVLRAEQTGALAKEYVQQNVKPPPQRPQVTSSSAQALLTALEKTRDDSVYGRRCEEASQEEQDRFNVDDKALRFFAYVTEQIRESAVENSRLRKVSLTFFLSDETFIIQEPRVANSGLRGGTLLKRQRIPVDEQDRANREGGGAGPSHVTINDLAVGRSVRLFGYEYHLYGCDAFTREFLTAIGADVAEDQEPPADDYQTGYRAKRINGKTASKSFETKDLSATLESLASRGRCAQHYPGELERTQRYVRDSGKVLSFSGFWNDEDALPAPTIRTLDVRYFIEDDTVLIVEKPNPATKADTTQRTFLSRRRLPVSGKPAKVVELTFAGRINGQREPYLGGDDRYYDVNDLYIGAELNVFGRRVTLYDCDGYTREYMASELGADPGPSIDIAGLFPRPEPKKAPVPPPTGYGTDEDSLSSCSIQLKAPRKDMSGFKQHGDEKLTFEMKLHQPEVPEDKLRKFLLTYYLADNEIQVTEVAVRNTGFTGGRFLKKGRVEKHKGERDYFSADDFHVGAIVNITGFNFEITAMDEHSRKYRQFAATKGRDPESLTTVSVARLQQLLAAFREYVTVRFYTNTEAFRAFDRDHDGVITLEEMKEVLKGSLITPHDDEAVALVKLFDSSNDGRVSYRDFMDAVAINGGPEPPKEAIPTEPTAANATARSAAHQTQRRAVLKRTYERFEARCMNGFEIFRLFSTMPRAYRGTQTVELASLTNGSKDTVVTPVQLRRGLVEVLNMTPTAHEMAILLEFFFPTLPVDQYDAPADRTTRYGIRVAEFQRKLTEMSSIGQL